MIDNPETTGSAVTATTHVTADNEVQTPTIEILDFHLGFPPEPRDNNGRQLGRLYKAPEDLFWGVNPETGKPQAPWLIARRRIKKKYLNEVGKIQTAAMELSMMEPPDEDDEGELSPEVARLVKIISTGNDRLAVIMNYLILDWNFIDFETEKPLPKPDQGLIKLGYEEALEKLENGSAFDPFSELDSDQNQWIMKVIQNQVKYIPTEGNGKSTPS